MIKLIEHLKLGVSTQYMKLDKKFFYIESAWCNSKKKINLNLKDGDMGFFIFKKY